MTKKSTTSITLTKTTETFTTPFQSTQHEEFYSLESVQVESDYNSFYTIFGILLIVLTLVALLILFFTCVAYKKRLCCCFCCKNTHLVGFTKKKNQYVSNDPNTENIANNSTIENLTNGTTDKKDDKGHLTDFVKTVITGVDTNSPGFIIYNRHSGNRDIEGNNSPRASQLSKEDGLEMDVACEVYPSGGAILRGGHKNPDASSEDEISLSSYEDNLSRVYYPKEELLSNQAAKYTAAQVADRLAGDDLSPRPLSAEEEVIFDEFFNSSSLSLEYEDSVRKLEANSKKPSPAATYSQSTALQSKKKSFVYTNQSIALNVATTNNAQLASLADSEVDLKARSCGTGNIILVSASGTRRTSKLSKRSTFSAKSVASNEFLPEVTGDPGLALKSSNPKVIFSSNHYNVCSVDTN